VSLWAGGLDPGISVNLYRSLVTRVGRDLLRPPGMVWLVGNPPPPDHWIAQEFGYDGHGEPQNPYPDRRLYLGTREDNQRNLKADYYERLQRVWGVNTPMARRYLDGAWTSFGVEKPFQNARYPDGRVLTFHGRFEELWQEEPHEIRRP